jgi:hypothetical protein
MQTVWEFEFRKDDFRFLFSEKRKTVTRAHLLRKRRAMFDSSLFHGEWLQTGLIFKDKDHLYPLRANHFI